MNVWWWKLGIAVERIEPGKPQQNGRHERMHRTLKAETARPPATNRNRQQQKFDRFRREYNQERPHEALGQRPPAAVYEASAREYPRELADPDYPGHWERRRVRHDGRMKFQGQKYFLSEALAREAVGEFAIGSVEQGDLDRPEPDLPVGFIDFDQLAPRFAQRQPPRGLPLTQPILLPIRPV